MNFKEKLLAENYSHMQVCAMIEVSPQLLINWRSNGKFPSGVKYCRHWYYPKKEVHQWIADRNESLGIGGDDV